MGRVKKRVRVGSLCRGYHIQDLRPGGARAQDLCGVSGTIDFGTSSCGFFNAAKLLECTMGGSGPNRYRRIKCRRGDSAPEER
jgi:hypothetical protein